MSITLERLKLAEEAYLYWNKFSDHLCDYGFKSQRRHMQAKQNYHTDEWPLSI